MELGPRRGIQEQACVHGLAPLPFAQISKPLLRESPTGELVMHLVFRGRNAQTCRANSCNAGSWSGFSRTSPCKPKVLKSRTTCPHTRWISTAQCDRVRDGELRLPVAPQNHGVFTTRSTAKEAVIHVDFRISQKIVRHASAVRPVFGSACNALCAAIPERRVRDPV